MSSEDEAGRDTRGRDAATRDAARGSAAFFREAAPRDEPAPERIGRYRVLREIGRGGMGVVYQARSEDEHLRHLVAVKVLKRGMDSEAIARRFQIERRVLGALTHESIARVLDGGVAEDRRPFFALEHIEGQPLDDYCDTHRLDVPERLALFRRVCDAVAHAHRNLIVHRDLKPSNILVTKEGVPKLLDFGIAKMLNDAMAPIDADPTATELRLMTPEYASPEQVRGDPISTASDVYSLGVVLYELMTGHRPYRLESRAMQEISRVICEIEPERPSTAVDRVEEVRTEDLIGTRPPAGGATTHTITPESVARVRGGKPSRLRSRLRGDLDNIILKAMEKAPQRRYESARELADDIDRHLDGLPVIARPPSVAYRAGKFVRRHRAEVAATTLGAAAVLATVVAIANARVAAAREREMGEMRRSAAAMAGLVDRAAPTKGRDPFVPHMTAELGQLFDELPHVPGSTEARLWVAEFATTFLESLSVRSGGDPEVERGLAFAYARLGDVYGGMRSDNVGNEVKARDAYQNSLHLRRRLAAAAPGDEELQAELAESLMLLADLDRPTDPRSALEHFEESRVIRRRLVEADPASVERTRKLTMTLIAMGDTLRKLGRNDEAEALYVQVIDRLEQARALEPLENVRRDLAIAHLRLAYTLLKSGRPREGIGHCDRALDLRQGLVEDRPESPRYRRDLAMTQLQVAQLFLDLERPPWERALAHLDAARAARTSTADEGPLDARGQFDLSVIDQVRGKALRLAGRHEEALDALEASDGLMQPLLASQPDSVHYATQKAAIDEERGNVLAAMGRDADAVDSWREAEHRLAILAERVQDDADLKDALRRVRERLAE